ncbi:hypothetical protein BX600DRAFT_531022 [Xylariales sp. PMI_506]|nr:hypothetical protein BX600DRAFT_531022 [Xylariales sp. PMI_506]
MADSKIKVAIAGGGIAGLALAAGLIKKPQFDVHVYEGAKEYLDIGGGLALHPNGIAAMKQIGPEVCEAYFNNALSTGEEGQEFSTDITYAEGPYKGELVYQLGKAKGRRTIARSDLLAAFASLLPSDRITFGKRLVDIEEKSDQAEGDAVKLHFKDGTTTSADVLIGADGIHSCSRRYCLGPDHPAALPVNRDGWLIYRALAPSEELLGKGDPSWPYRVPILIGSQGYFNVQTIKKGARINASVVLRSAAHANKYESEESDLKFTQVDNLPPLDRHLFDDYIESAQQLAALIEEQAMPPWTVTDHDPAPSYVSAGGRVCIVGDAAHATAPWSGQGASQALQDSAVIDAIFAHVTSRDQITTALQAFDSARREKSQRIVEMTRQIGRMYLFAEGDIHEYPDRMREFFGKFMDLTSFFDVAGESQQAADAFLKTVS